jgi:DNA polymerase-3 subunit epsilon
MTTRQRAVTLEVSTVRADDDEKPDGYLISIRPDDNATLSNVTRQAACFDLDLLDAPVCVERSNQSLGTIEYVVFDSETTGLNAAKGDEIIQLAGVRIVNGKTVPDETFDELVDPQRPIPASSTKIHGITDDMVRDAPTITAIAEQFHRFCRDCVLVAHNAPFDLEFLRKSERECGIRFDNPILDTVLLSAIVFGVTDDHSLDALAARLDIEIQKELRHTATGDSVATSEAFRKLIPLLETSGIRTLDEAIAAENAIRPKLRMSSIPDQASNV